MLAADACKTAEKAQKGGKTRLEFSPFGIVRTAERRRFAAGISEKTRARGKNGKECVKNTKSPPDNLKGC